MNQHFKQHPTILKFLKTFLTVVLLQGELILQFYQSHDCIFVPL